MMRPLNIIPRHRRLAFALVCLCAMLPFALAAAQESTSEPPTSSAADTATSTFTQTPTQTATQTTTPTSTRTLRPTSTPTSTPNSARVVITQAPTASPTATSIPVFSLESGSIEGSISDSSPLARYSFTGQRDEGVIVRMETTSGSLDPFLNLYASDGRLIATNDDQAPGERNAQISLSLPSGGTYIIEATRFAQSETLTSGTFRLTLTRSTAQATGTPTDPLAERPNFGVPYSALGYQDVGTGQIDDDQSSYFAFPGQQGDLVRLIMSRTSGNLLPRLRVYDSQRQEIGRDAQTRDSEAIVYATLPQTGWYLIETGRRGVEGGAGTFDLFVNRLANAVLQVGQSVTGDFTPETPILSYIINARLGDQISANMFTTDPNSGVQPSLELLDLGLRTLDRASGERFVTVSATLPRSAPYILRVSNGNPSASGSFSLRLSSIPVNPVALNTTLIQYNDQQSGVITNDAPVHLYRFNGKTGELVTITMSRGSTDSTLDPYLILMDGDLNELAANDDSGVSRDARIVQYRLPKDGDYVIVASRSSLAAGETMGDYRLAITAGAIRLTEGALSMSLNWPSAADLNLYVRDPQHRSIDWSNPNSPSGGIMQVDSNTGCTTPSAEPVEHIYWPSAPPAGDYDLWAWYQAGCGQSAPVTFTLTIRVGGTVITSVQSTLNPGERFQMALRIASTGEGFIIDPGTVTVPSTQQTISEGGDPLIVYGDSVEGDLSDSVYARFYQFYGTQGDQIRITLARTDGTLDPLLVLRNAADEIMPDGVNDDANSATRDSELNYTLTYTGQYIVAVSRYGVRDGTTTGRYRLTLERTGP